MSTRCRIVLVACVTGFLVLLGTTAAFATEGDEILLLTDGITRGEDSTTRSADQMHPEVDPAVAQQSRLGKPPIEDWISTSASLSLCCICPAPPAVVKLTLSQPFNYPCVPPKNPYIINRGCNGTIAVKGIAKGYPIGGKVRSRSTIQKLPDSPQSSAPKSLWLLRDSGVVASENWPQVPVRTLVKYSRMSPPFLRHKSFLRRALRREHWITTPESLKSHNEFEDRPLHGVFLVDAGGHIRYQKVSAEPFLDVKFLQGESRRMRVWTH